MICILSFNRFSRTVAYIAVANIVVSSMANANIAVAYRANKKSRLEI